MNFRPFAVACLISLTATFAVLSLSPVPAQAQWTHRYALLAGYSHHVYVEGFELPAVDAGVLDPAPSPDGRSLAFASRGWIWILELEGGTARRLTRGGGMDSRPAWSPDGQRVAFVRDDTRLTRIVVVNASTAAEERTIEHGGIALDPAFSRDGAHLYYVSSAAGVFDLWRFDLRTGEQTRVTPATTARRLQLRPQPHPDGEHIVYLHKAGYADEVRVHRTSDATDRTLLADGLLSQTRPALSPDGRVVALNRPTHDGTWHLVLVELANPSHPVTLATGLPLTPAWSPDGRWIYFVESDAGRNMRLRRVPGGGGAVQDVAIRHWEWGEPTGTLRVRTRTTTAAGAADVAARLHAADAAGHPMVPQPGQAWFDGQHGRVFFYSPGVIDLVVPAGRVSVSAVSGLTAPVVSGSAVVPGGGTTEIVLDLQPVWDARRAGWYSGDHHFHLNYGGLHDLAPADLLPMMRGEGLDVATPLLANLHNRFEDRRYWGWRNDGPQIVRFGQEVRAHFHGHVGMFGVDSLFWPWIWGPGNPVYNRADISNAEATRHARAQGGVGVYVHPVSRRDPFTNLASIPLELVTDAVLGDMHAIELACLWTDELGTAALWYRLLNIGRPVLAVAGTDVMKDYFRTMAIGTTRVYAKVDGPFTFETYSAALQAGRSFVSTGPLLEFTVRADGPAAAAAPGTTGDVGPGGVISAARAAWSLNVHSAVPYDRVELLVNGSVVWSGAGAAVPGTRTHSGTIDLPPGGWIAVRAYSEGSVEWPAMNPTAFAHSSPIWIGSIGSTDNAARAAAAADLLRALENARERLETGYADAEMTSVRERFDRAHVELQRLAGGAARR
jgi:TolB protein